MAPGPHFSFQTSSPSQACKLAFFYWNHATDILPLRYGGSVLGWSMANWAFSANGSKGILTISHTTQPPVKSTWYSGYSLCVVSFGYSGPTASCSALCTDCAKGPDAVHIPKSFEGKIKLVQMSSAVIAARLSIGGFRTEDISLAVPRGVER